MIEIYNESCFDTLANVPIGQFNVVLTSPFYNTNQKAGKTRTLMNCKPKHYDYVRYDEFVDNMENEEYYDFTVRLFDEFDRVLNKCGVVLYNISYGAENTNCMIETINAIVTRTNFSMADIIGWKKKAAVPNNVSPNRLTRIFEFVFVFCRKDEINEFYMNKKQVECGRLMGFPDEWCKDVKGSDNAQYRMWGNGVALPCVLYIMEGIAEKGDKN